MASDDPKEREPISAARPGWDPAPDLDERALDLFATLHDLSADECARELERGCGGDERLRAAVLALLHDHRNPPAILARVMAATADADEPTRPGAVIGPYRIVETIGRGGMGIVYRALQDRPHRTVALKVMSPGGGDDDMATRFAREVEVLGLLQHPGICRIYGAGSVDLGLGVGETMYFAMEFVEGRALGEFARERKLDVAARCTLLAQVCDAVQHAHERGVVHRDLKPNNILVADGTGGAPLVKVLDFGIARAIQADVAPTLNTRTGMLLGTLQYMSPEQLNGNARNIDPRSDVYSLGVLLYELLTGRLPLRLDDLPLAEVCRLVAQREPTPLGAVDRRLRGDLATIVHKALEKDREDRYQSAAELGDDLRRFLRHEPILARRPTATYQLRRFAQRNRALVGGVLATMLALVAGLIGVALLAARNDSLAVSERAARKGAEDAGARLRASLYRSQMRLGAEAMLLPGGVARVREITNQWLPVANEPDLRGFEWHLLWASCHRELRVLPGEPLPTGLQWLVDGERLLSTHQRAAVLWQAETGALLQRFDASHKPVAASAASGDGAVLVQATSAEELAAIDLPTGARLATFRHADEVHRCTLSRDGGLLACFGPDVGVVIWETRTGRRLAELERPACGAMGFSRDGRLFAAGLVASSDSLVRIWRTDDWATPPRDLRGSPDAILELAFDARGQRLGTISHEGRLRVWDVDSAVLQHDLLHDDGLRGLAFHPTDDRVAVACRNYIAYVHDLARGTQQALRGHTGVVAGVAWSPAGDQLATVSDDATLRFWDVDAPSLRRELQLPEDGEVQFGQLVWSADSRAVAISSPGRIGATWNVDTGASTEAFAIEVAGRRFARSRDGRIECVEAAGIGAGRAARSIAVGEARFLAVSRDGRWLAIAAGRQGPLWLWNGEDQQPARHEFQEDVRGMAWIDGNRLAIVDSTDAVRILDGARGKQLHLRPVPECTLALAGAPHGDDLAIGCVDQAVRIWSPGRDEMRVLRGHTGHVQAVAFSPDGARLASGGRDRTVRIWDVEAGAEVASLACDDHVIALAWSPDGMRLAALLARGRVVLWDARLPLPR